MKKMNFTNVLVCCIGMFFSGLAQKSVTTSTRLQNFKVHARTTIIDSSKVDQVVGLLEEKYRLTNEYESWLENCIICDDNTKYNIAYINTEFSNRLSKIIDFKEFEVLFTPALQFLIKKTTGQNWNTFLESQSIDKKYIPNFKTINAHYSKQYVLAEQYYNYDTERRNYELLNIKIEKENALKKALDGYNINKKTIDISFDTRIPFFIKRAKNAGVPEDKIHILVNALKKREEKNTKYHQDFAVWQKKYIVYFHDNIGSPQENYNELRKALADNLSLEQFKAMFVDQFQNKINREIKTKYSNLKNTYSSLDKKELEELRKLITDQVTTENVTFQYYNYDLKYAMQKLRAIQYKLDKKYKTTLKNLTEN